MKVSKGSTSDISLTDLIAGLSASGFSGRLTLNEGEHFCIVEFLNGNVVGAFGWKLEGDNALLHLFLEGKEFAFSISGESEVAENVNTDKLPRGSKHIIELIKEFDKDFGFLSGAIDKSIVINENVDADVDLTKDEMLEIMKFTEPIPVNNIVNERLKQNIYKLKKFFARNLLILSD